jgi:uncharacterized protein (DUF608 family)
MVQELDYNAQYGISLEESERVKDYDFVHSLKESLEKRIAMADNDPDRWTDFGDFIAELEEIDSTEL